MNNSYAELKYCDWAREILMSEKSKNSTNQGKPNPKNSPLILILGCLFFPFFVPLICLVLYMVTSIATREQPSFQPVRWFDRLYNPARWTYDRPSIEDISKTFYLSTPSSRDGVEKLGYEGIPEGSSISFYQDGTFTSQELPDFIWEWGDADREYTSGSGTWRFAQEIHGSWAIHAHFDTVGGHDVDAGANSFWIIGEEPPYSLFNWINETTGLGYEIGEFID